jgi:peroxiredoxin
MKKVVSLIFLVASTVFSYAQTEAKALVVGTTAPIIKAKSSDGKFNLSKELKKGAVVVMFYRGNWCPYCSKQLKAYTDSLQYLTAKGAQIIAVTPETFDGVAKTKDKTKTTISIISDKKLKIANAYNVNYTVDAATVEKYKGYGIDFDKTNGFNGANLPVPAVYIISKEGKIKYAYFNKDYSKRPSVAELLSHL